MHVNLNALLMYISLAFFIRKYKIFNSCYKILFMLHLSYYSQTRFESFALFRFTKQTIFDAFIVAWISAEP